MCDTSDPHEQLNALKFELEQYSPGLSKRSHAIIANKMDLEDSKEKFFQFENWIKNSSSHPQVIPISAKTNMNISSLLKCVKLMCDNNT